MPAGDITALLQSAGRGTPGATRDEQVLSLHSALEHFEAEFPQLAHLVKQRYFVGLTIPEVAEATDSSSATIKREWTFARAWLRDRIDRDASAQP